MSEIGTVGVAAAKPAGSTGKTAHANDFSSRLDASLGSGRARDDDERTQRTAASGTASQTAGTVSSLAQNAASMFGNVFGALGADIAGRTAASAAGIAKGAASSAIAAYTQAG